MRTLELNQEEKAQRVKEQNRLRAAKYYASKKNIINDKAKVQRKSKSAKTEVISEIMTLPSKTAHSQKEGKLLSVEEEVKFVPNQPAPPKEMSPRNKAKYNLAMIELQKQKDKEEAQHEVVSEAEDDSNDTYDKVVKNLKSIKYDSESTQKKYIENFKTIVKLVGINTYSKFLKLLVNEPKKVISILENATHGKAKKSYSLNSIRDYINLTLFYIDNLNIRMNIEDKEIYKDIAAILVAQSHRQIEKIRTRKYHQ